MDEIRKIEPEEVIITETHSSPEPMRTADFECHEEDSEWVYRDFYRTVFCRRNAVLSVAYFIYCAVLFAVAVILWGKTDLVFTIAIAVMFAASLFFFFKNNSDAKKSLEKVKYSRGGKTPPINAYFYDDEIVSVDENPDKTVTFRYKDIKSVRKTASMYFIELNYKLCLLLSKNVTGGKNFEEYILAKATGMKKKKIKNTANDNKFAVIFLALNGLLAAAAVVLYFVIR